MQNTAGPQRTIMMNQTGRVTNQINNQKILFVTQRPPTPGCQPSPQPQQNTVVKFVSNTNTLNQQKMVTTQKLGITHAAQAGQSPISVVSKSRYQQAPTKKPEQMQPPTSIDDLSHLV